MTLSKKRKLIEDSKEKENTPSKRKKEEVTKEEEKEKVPSTKKEEDNDEKESFIIQKKKACNTDNVIWGNRKVSSIASMFERKKKGKELRKSSLIQESCSLGQRKVVEAALYSKIGKSSESSLDFGEREGILKKVNTKENGPIGGQEIGGNSNPRPCERSSLE